jgi:hypothetical protein
MFDGIESTIARIAFGVPAVKGIEFGAGFGAARVRGSENNDPYGYDAERRVILLLMEQYAGRVPMGAVADVAAAASVSRQTVFNAVRRFLSYFPGAISQARRSKG